MERKENPKSLAIYIDGQFTGVDNERACTLIEQAVAHGVKVWGKKDSMAIQLGAHWLEGWMEAAEIQNEEKDVLRNVINNYFFV